MGIRVLLVDDVPEVRRLLRTALRFRGGFEVVGEASDGAGAVELARSMQPDVVVLDLGLPDLAGREVLVQLRRHSPTSKVVVFSGAETVDEEWIATHVEGYVLKDAELDYVVDLLESVGRPRETEAVLDLPRSLSSASEARRFVAEKVAEWDLAPLLDDALVVTSELAANAVTHAHSSCRLRVSLNPTSLRIDVLDTGTGTPEPRAASNTAEHGRGLQLVATLADRWGAQRRRSTREKTVWFELLVPRPVG